MKVAIISDIHANRYAMYAFLEFLSQNPDISIVINAGDIINIGPHPQEVASLVLEDSRFVSVLGNNEEAILQDLGADPNVNKHRKWTHSRLNSQILDGLRKLPPSRTIELEGVNIFVSHARPNNASEFPLILRNKTAKEMLEDYSGMTPDVVVFGHTHEPFFGKFDNISFVNPGALGISKINHSTFAILHIESGLTGIEIKPLAWDREALAGDFIKRDVPDKEFILERYFNINSILEF